MSGDVYPKKGEPSFFCEHQANNGEWPRMRGAHALRALPDQMVHPGEEPHDWLFLCSSCFGVRERDAAAPLRGFCWTLQKDLPVRDLEHYGAVL